MAGHLKERRGSVRKEPAMLPDLNVLFTYSARGSGLSSFPATGGQCYERSIPLGIISKKTLTAKP